jgi:hydrogenase maturation protease
VPNTLIVGYGNTLRGDDGAGRAVAERLQAVLRDPDVRVLSLHQLTPELMLDLARADRAVFVDASSTGHAGRYMRIPLYPASQCAKFTHHATPEALLAGTRSLYGRCPESSLYVIPGEAFDSPDRLSAPVERAVGKLVAFLKESLQTASAQL